MMSVSSCVMIIALTSSWWWCLMVVLPPASLAVDRDGWSALAGVERSKHADDMQSSEMEEVMDLLQSVAHQLTSLKSVIHNLKLHSQMIYKHLHKLHKDKCQMTALKKEIPQWTGLAPEAYQNHESGVVSQNVQSSDAMSQCPAGFHQNLETKKCYRVQSDQRVSWPVARDRCKSIGAELVSIRSAREQNFIGELLRKKNGGKCDYWTGLTSKATSGHQSWWSASGSEVSLSPTWTGRRHQDSHDVRWYWSGDGTSLGRYSNWNDNEPNDLGGGGANAHASSDGVCVQMLWIFDWKWNDASCGHSLSCFICQTLPPQPDNVFTRRH